MTKVGLFGIGLDTYWAQFDGLLDNLKEYQKQIKKNKQWKRTETIINKTDKETKSIGIQHRVFNQFNMTSEFRSTYLIPNVKSIKWMKPNNAWGFLRTISERNTWRLHAYQPGTQSQDMLCPRLAMCIFYPFCWLLLEPLAEICC